MIAAAIAIKAHRAFHGQGDYIIPRCGIFMGWCPLVGGGTCAGQGIRFGSVAPVHRHCAVGTNAQHRGSSAVFQVDVHTGFPIGGSSWRRNISSARSDAIYKMSHSIQLCAIWNVHAFACYSCAYRSFGIFNSIYLCLYAHERTSLNRSHCICVAGVNIIVRNSRNRDLAQDLSRCRSNVLRRFGRSDRLCFKCDLYRSGSAVVSLGDRICNRSNVKRLFHCTIVCHRTGDDSTVCRNDDLAGKNFGGNRRLLEV